jgi:GGDEF domain-containing protein
MDLDWDSDFVPLPPGARLEELSGFAETEFAFGRLDTLLPADPLTSAVTYGAFRVYLQSIMDLMAREGGTLSVIALGVDDTPAVRFFGTEGAGLLGRAVVRCVRQESRSYDVLGRTRETDSHGIPTFLLACPLLNEERAAQLAERLCAAMVAQSAQDAIPWLTVSGGVASLALDMEDADAMLLRALSTLQGARRQGGGQVWRHSDTLRRLAEEDNLSA